MSNETPASNEAPAPDESVDPTLSANRARKPKRGWWLVAAVAVVVVAAGGYGIAQAVGAKDSDKNGAQDNAKGSTSDGQTAPTDQVTLTVGLALEPTNLNIRTTAGAALDQALIDNVYQGLVSRDPTEDIVPSLATDWTVSEDALTYTFNLAAGAKFSNGHVLDSADVVWSIEDLVANGHVGSEYLGALQAIEAPDPATVVITLDQPYPDLLWALSGRAGLVLDQEADNDLDSTAIGSGPFEFEQWRQGDSITLVRDDDYWGETAPLKSVVFRYLTDYNAAVNAFNAGDVDVLAPLSTDLREQIKIPGAEIVEADASDKFVLAFNNAQAPLDDLRVRQAIRYALDHPAIITARGSVDKELGGPIPPLDPGHEDLTGLYPHDVDKAKELLAEAGYADGLKLTLTIPAFYESVLPDTVVSQLAQAGIDVTVEAVEFSAWLEDVYTNKDYQLSIVDHAESHDFGNWANPDSYFGYDNAEVQALYAKSQVATSTAEAEKALSDAARIVSEEAAADWLVNFRQLVALRPGIEGFPPAQINNRLNLGQVVASPVGS
ncbi:MAG: ABC transporter substrate-binding protein [Bifidobacteriaceae bacterium]|jgi:peptide/nickel transport system substrate-binding protein|nr:ABC transporter substrate-binding protein [Bifidobacteriaceae bacterium]